jgi:dsDNA-binding SOS-regulon protein
MLEEIRPQQMAKHIGSEFDVSIDSARTIRLTLTDVVESVKTERSEAFSLFFRGPSDTFLPQRTRTMKHPALGEFELFLVPIAQDKDGFQYEAVFNLMH